MRHAWDAVQVRAIAENALLHQQLIVASRKVKRPDLKAHER